LQLSADLVANCKALDVPKCKARSGWLVYEGADIGKFGHTLPLAKAMDDVSWPTARMATLAC